MTCCRCRFWKRKGFAHGVCWLHEVYVEADEQQPCWTAKVAR